MASKVKISDVFTNKRIGITMLLAFSSGLPLPLTKATLKNWMASEGASLSTIGLFSLVSLPYTLKPLWSPFIDRYSLPFLNRRSGWMVVFQVALMMSIAALGFSRPLDAPWMCAMLALVVAFFSASQDIVIDAYRADLLEPEERGPGAGVTVLGARIALLVAGGVAVSMAEKLAWSQVYLIMAGLMSVGLVTSFFAPATPKVSPPKSLSDAIIKPFTSFFSRRGSLIMLALVLLYKLGDAVAGEMTAPFLFQLGFSKLDIGAVYKSLGMIATIVGALLGGGLTAKIGLHRSLWLLGFFQAASNLTFLPLAYAGKHYGLMLFAVGTESVCGGMGTAAFTAYLISLTDKHFSATQYALLSSVMALTPIGGGVFAGFLAQHLFHLYF
jgi:PAT family beta-lactamase induction signal transducer AmpG